MNALVRVALTTALLLAPAWGQAAPPASGREAAAARYQRQAWGAPGPELSGLPFSNLSLPGHQRLSHTVDPRRGEAQTRWAPLGEAAPSLTIRLRLHDQAEAARDGLLARLAVIQGALEPLPGPDVSFAARDAQGRLVRVLGVRGNAELELSLLDKRADLGAALAAVEALLAGSPRREPGTSLPAPRVLGLELERDPRVGAATRFQLRCDPEAPPADFAVLSADAAGAVAAPGGGWWLTAARPGPLVLEGWVCSKQLQRAPLRLELEVGPGD